MRNRMIMAVASLSLLAGTYGAHGALLLDFGVTTPKYSGTNDPAHAVLAVPITESTFSAIGGDVAAGVLKYSDGTAATGVSVEVGIAAGGILAVNWEPNPSWASYTGGSGIFGTALTRDRLFASENRATGVRVKGLTAGIYDVYAIVHWANDTGSVNFGIGTDAAAGTIAKYNDVGMTTFSAPAVSNDETSWDLNHNYWVQRVTLSSATDYITMITGDGVNNNGLIGMEIVAVHESSSSPEPSTALMLAMAGTLILRRHRKVRG